MASGRGWLGGALALLALLEVAWSAPDAARTVALAGSLHPLARRQNDLGRVDGAQLLAGITLRFVPTDKQAAELASLLRDLSDSASPRYHRWLTPEEYGERFGADAQTLATVVAWLEDGGFTLQRVARSRTRITVAGTVAQAEAAFGTELHRYEIDGAIHFAMARAPSVPEALSSIVAGIEGLDDIAPHFAIPARDGPARGRSPFFNLGGEHALGPEDFATLYDIAKLHAKGIDGTGTTIAITGRTFVTLSDIDDFRTLTGLPAIDLSTVLVPGSGRKDYIDAAGLQEAELDVELSSAPAPNAKMIYVYSGGGAGFNEGNALEWAVDNRLADIVTNSWGRCEADWSRASVASLEAIADQASAEGMTIVAATGDTGAAACDTPAGATAATTKGLAVLFPASLPNVTSVGGTQLDEGTGRYWSATNDPKLGSVLSYVPETAWNEVPALGLLWAGGGGVSTLFAKPGWQAGAGVPNDGRRDVPDVALAAAVVHDPLVAYYSAPAVNEGSGFYFVGGTSVSTPSFAGVLALVQQAVGKGRLGAINPTLYALARQSPSPFHDITRGNNVVPCQAGSTGCPAAPPYEHGFTATPGYDLTTGLGSVDAAALADAWIACEASSCASPSSREPDAGTSGESHGAGSCAFGGGASREGSGVGAWIIGLLLLSCRRRQV